MDDIGASTLGGPLTRTGLRRRFNSAEAVADVLRERILSGEIPADEPLAKQEELTDEFGVSKAAIREASRILETEGLLRVRRGNVGGAEVHVPTPTNVAYALAQVLHARGADLGDVGSTIVEIEPLCAGLCAARPDRDETVVPALREIHGRMVGCLDEGDGAGAALAARDWHEALVHHSGLETLGVLAGALEAVWSSHVRAGLPATSERGLRPDQKLSASVVDDHAAIIELIAAGDVDGAKGAARAHLSNGPRIHAESDELTGTPVHAHIVRNQLFGG